MSSAAIARRLKQTEQLRRLSLSLMKAKLLTDEEAVKLRQKFRESKAMQRKMPPDCGDSSES